MNIQILHIRKHYGGHRTFALSVNDPAKAEAEAAEHID